MDDANDVARDEFLPGTGDSKRAHGASGTTLRQAQGERDFGGARAGLPDAADQHRQDHSRVPLHHPAERGEASDSPSPSHEPRVSIDPRSGEELAAARPASPSTRTPRHNEWTREKMAAFLRELAATQSVAQAAKAVGMSRTAAYNLRNRLQGQPFALGWEVALELGLNALAQAVVDRALNGTEVEHYYHGELVATTRKYDNRLAQWVLANPWQVGRQQVAREYAAQDFDALLERVESDSLVWLRGEAVPGPGWPYRNARQAEAGEDEFIGKRSWYVSDQVLTERTKRVRKA